MKRYIILADICFDFSGEEYTTKDIDNIFLGMVSDVSETEAKEKGDVLLNNYCDEEYGAERFTSTIELKEIDNISVGSMDDLAFEKYPFENFDGYNPQEDENEEYRNIWIDGFRTCLNLFNLKK